MFLGVCAFVFAMLVLPGVFIMSAEGKTKLEAKEHLVQKQNNLDALLKEIENDTWKFPVCELYSKHKYKELPSRKADITKIKKEIIKILNDNKIPDDFHKKYEDNWKELWEEGKNLFEQDNLVIIQKARAYKQENRWSEASVLYKKIAKEDKSLEVYIYSCFCEHIAQLIFEKDDIFEGAININKIIREIPKRINDKNINGAISVVNEVYDDLMELIDVPEPIINIKGIAVGSLIYKLSFSFSEMLNTIAETYESNKDISVSCYEKAITLMDTVLRRCYLQIHEEEEVKELIKQYKIRLHYIDPSKKIKTKSIDKKRLFTVVVGIIFILIIIKIAVGDGGSHHSNWSELSKQEKDNARWAYNVQQELDK